MHTFDPVKMATREWQVMALHWPSCKFMLHGPTAVASVSSDWVKQKMSW